MSSLWQKTLMYLGLVDEEQLDEEVEPRPPAAARSTRPPSTRPNTRGANSRPRHRGRSPGGATSRRRIPTGGGLR